MNTPHRASHVIVRHTRAPAMLVAAAIAFGACASAGARPGRASGARATLVTAIDSMVAQAKFRSALWGILIVDPTSGDTLYSRNATRLFMPASNQKILTGSVSLALLGPDYRYRTTFATTGAISDGVLHGDLLVIGRGDPSVSDHMQTDAMAPLRLIADSLIARGVRQITGRVRAAGDAFPDANIGYGWSWDDLDFPYSARIDELIFNEGFTRVLVRAADTPGGAPTVRTLPARTVPRVLVRANTVPREQRGRGPDGTLSLMQDSSGTPGGIVLGGTIAVGDSASLTIAHLDPSAAYLAALGEALAERGITIDTTSAVRAVNGSSRDASAAHADLTGALDTLATLTSPPLREILRAFEKPSQNQIGELLLKTLALERTGVGRADSGARVVRDQVLAWGGSPDGLRVRDGSGLSRYNVVSPETIVRVLNAVRADTAFRVFFDALPIAGVDGTIANRMRGTLAQGNVHAKTGSIDLARSLSGYVTTADGRMLIFSILCNNWTTPAREVEEVGNAIAARLAAFDRRTR